MLIGRGWSRNENRNVHTHLDYQGQFSRTGGSADFGATLQKSRPLFLNYVRSYQAELTVNARSLITLDYGAK